MPSLFTSTLLLSTAFTSALALPTIAKPHKTRYISQLHKRDLTRRYVGTSDVEVIAGVIGLQGINWVTSVDIGGFSGELFIDTGSSDLWVYGDQSLTKGPIYIPGESNADPGETFDIQYVGADNWVKGEVAIDSVSIAGLQIPSMKTGVATSAGATNVAQEFDGLVGLGFIGLNTIQPNPSPTFMMMAIPYLDYPVFAVNLKGDSTGSIEFGNWDDSAYQGDLMSASIDNSSSAWHVTGVQFDGVDESFSQTMLFDTGARYTSVDSTVAAAYWSQVEGAVNREGGWLWEYPCGTTLPDFNMYIEGQTVTVPGSLLAWADAADGEAGDGMCEGAITGGSDEGDEGTVGDVFFEAYYVVFNQAEPSIQFALSV